MSNPKITMADLDGLPDELIKELKLNNSFKMNWRIINLIKSNDGKISIDKLIINYYHEHKEVLVRQNLNAKLYRMVQQGLLVSVPNSKGVYELSEKTKEQNDE
tara:strand:- start:2035 stop:2343 length:309 start_codon:yes stop_codon:yes gene_type:complete